MERVAYTRTRRNGRGLTDTRAGATTKGAFFCLSSFGVRGLWAAHAHLGVLTIAGLAGWPEFGVTTPHDSRRTRTFVWGLWSEPVAVRVVLMRESVNPDVTYRHFRCVCPFSAITSVRLG